MQLKHEKSCGAVIVREVEGQRQYLLVHQQAGHWGLPKGHVEPGETEVQTALREIGEETGLRVAIDTNFRHVMTYSPAREVTKDVVFFAAHCDDEDLSVQLEEVSEAVWLPYGDATALVTHESARGVLHAAEDYFSSEGSA